MIKRALAIIFLFCLLAACAPSAPAIQTEASLPPPGSATPSQALPPTSAPSPSVPPTKAPSPQISLTPTPGSDLAIKRIAQLGGSIHGIQMVGDVAYVGMGSRLAAIDISQHEKPTLISQSEPLPGLVTQVLQLASEPALLLLVNAGKFLVVMDVSIPGELKPVGRLALQGAISSLIWDSSTRIAYAEGSVYQSSDRYAGFISSVSLDAKNQLELINTVPLPEKPWSLALGNGNLYAGTEGYEGGLYYILVNASGELSTPRLVIPSTPIDPLIPVSMQVIGDRLYLSHHDFRAYDITNPEQPVQAWATGLSGGPVIASFATSGNEVFVFGWTILSEFMRAVITLPEPIEGFPLGETASATTLHNGDYLVAWNALQIYNTADPQNLRLVGIFQSTVNDAIGAAANENVVFVVDNGAEDGQSQAVLRALSLPDLQLLGQAVVEVPNSEYWLRGVALEGDRLYNASKNRVWTYDVSSNEPALLGTLQIEGREINAMAALNLYEQRLVMISQPAKESSLLRTFDLTDPQKPAELGEPFFLEEGEILGMEWDGFTLYAALRPIYETKFFKLYRFDMDVSGPSLKDSGQVTGYATTMAIDPGTITLTGSDNLYIVSRDEPEPLKLLAQATLPEHGMGVAIIQDKALVVVGQEYGAAQILVYNFQNLPRVIEVSGMDIPTSSLYQVPVLVTSKYVILANGAGGIEVLEYK